MIFERGLFSRLYRMRRTNKKGKCIVIDCYQRLLSVRQHTMIAELHLAAGSAVWKKALLLASHIPAGVQLEKQLLHFVVLSPTLDLPRYRHKVALLSRRMLKLSSSSGNYSQIFRHFLQVISHQQQQMHVIALTICSSPPNTKNYDKLSRTKQSATWK